MTHLKLLVCIVISIFISSCAVNSSLKPISASSDPDDYKTQPEYRLVESVLLNSILPWHQSLADNLAALQQQTVEFCADPTQDALNNLQKAWRNAMWSWSKISAYNFGPIDDTNVAWRFQFWPDPLNYVHRKFKSRLKGHNKAISQDELAEASVAIQGLSGIEYLLFDSATQTEDFYSSDPARCQILMGTASNLKQEGEVLNSAWQTKYQQAWMSVQDVEGAAAKYKRYVEDIFNGMLSSMMLIKDKKLAAPIGIKAAADLDKPVRKLKARYLESWRSASSLQQIQENIAAIETIYLMPNGFSWYLAQRASQPELDLQIKQHFSEIKAMLAGIQTTAVELIEKGKVGELERIYQKLNALYSMMRVDFMQTLNLHYRFNAHDGD